MNRIRTDRIVDMFAQLRVRQAGAFVPFVMIGDPNAEASIHIIKTLVDAGADMLELGIPFSDPSGDGPVVQTAVQRSLASGTTTAGALSIIRTVREQHTLPISILCYYNIVLQYGVDRFYRDGAAAGIDAVLIADVSLEEAGPLLECARKYGLHPIFMVSELTSSRRIAQIAAVGEGYLYVVARVGVTGERESIAPDLQSLFRRIRAHTPLPLLAGFGISTPTQVHEAIVAGADGVICGSAIVRRITESGQSGDDALLDLHFLTQMKRATVDL